MKLEKIAQCIEKIAPLKIQESYDNCGIQIGHPDDEVHKILLCLDVTEEVLHEAIAEKCDLIVSHHPLIFFGIKKIITNSLIYQAIQHHIAIYAAHTNLDAANFGVSTILGEKLGLKNLQILRKNPVDECFGLGIVGELENPLNETDFLDKVKKVCQIPVVRHSECCGKPIRTVALCGGAGGELLSEVIALKADAYLTADLKYHEFAAAKNTLLLVDAGHFESEQYAVDILYSEICKNFPTFAVRKTKIETNFVNYRS